MVKVRAMTISRIDQQVSLACRVFLKIISFVYSRFLQENDSERPRKLDVVRFKGSFKDCVNGGYLKESKHPPVTALCILRQPREGRALQDCLAGGTYYSL
ncbi:hypothetical protein SNK03_012613 [Fusarium graminearum]